jgi:hypothetical protein
MAIAHRRIDKLERVLMLPGANELLPSGVFVMTADKCDMVPPAIGGREMDRLSKPARGVVHAAPKIAETEWMA